MLQTATKLREPKNQNISHILLICLLSDAFRVVGNEGSRLELYELLSEAVGS